LAPRRAAIPPICLTASRTRDRPNLANVSFVRNIGFAAAINIAIRYV
jgi:hypothetical protein